MLLLFILAVWCLMFVLLLVVFSITGFTFTILDFIDLGGVLFVLRIVCFCWCFFEVLDLLWFIIFL